jgi:hypothetical protein
MPEGPATAPPLWFWIISGLALTWMLFGIFAFVMDLTTDAAAVEGLTEAERQLYAARPGWLFIVYGIAIFSGLGGVIGLLLRRAWAFSLLALSLVAVTIQFSYLLFGMRAIEVLGAAASLPFPMVIFAIGALLLWLALRARKRGWIM